TRGGGLPARPAGASAPAPPAAEPYLVGAFDGLAQRLLAGTSGVTAVVAMQFDMEEAAAECFAGSFYRNLLFPGRGLDEVVALARRDVALKMQGGHRAWVTPVVYWRCQHGKGFDLDPILPPEMNEATAREIEKLRREREERLLTLKEMAREPPAVFAALAGYRARVQAELKDVEDRLDALLGETVRLWGARARPEQEDILCRLT